MGDVDLGGTKKNVATPDKQKMVFVSIPGILGLMDEIYKRSDICNRYVAAFKDTISQTLSNKELRKEIYKIYGVKTLKKLKRLKPEGYEKMTEIFGNIWGE